MSRGARWVPWAALVAAIAVVHLGLRDVAPPGVLLPEPRAALPVLDALRAAPFAAISDARAAAIVSGVVFGRTDGVGPAEEAAFLESGLWHLLAASGQNIALVAGCCVVLARVAGGSRVWGAGAALVAIPMYVLVVGGGASIVRAGLMGELALVAWLAGRLADVRHLLVVAAAALCWVWPGAHLGLGMQLSFACVGVLTWLAGRWTRTLVAWGVPTWLAGGAAVTVLCGLATAPVLVLRTGAAPVTGTVANLLAVPLAAGVLVVGLAGSIVAAAGLRFVGEPVLVVAGWVASLLLRLAERGASLPGAQVESRVLLVGVPVLVLGSAALLERVGSRRWRRRIVRGAAAGTAVCCAVALAGAVAPHVGIAVPGMGGGQVPPRGAGELRLAVLDIGQGDATLLATDAGAVLVDVGPPDGEVVERVREQGVDRVVGIVLTHDSLDHRGGFEQALAGLDPAWVAMPTNAPGPWRRIRELAPEVRQLCSGDTFRLGDVGVEVWNPPCDGAVRQRTSDVHNDGAMVLLVRHGELRMLLPADAEAPVLVELGLPEVDLLRIPHHGSSDPALPQLLGEVRPEAAAISVGKGNTYDHPRRDVLDALRAAGVPTFRTDLDGSVTFSSDGRELRATSQR